MLLVPHRCEDIPPSTAVHVLYCCGVINIDGYLVCLHPIINPKIGRGLEAVQQIMDAQHAQFRG